MNFKKIYKNINVFQKKINSKKVIICLFTALTIFTAIDFISDKEEFIEIVEYKPFEEQAKFENNFQNNVKFAVSIDEKENFNLDSLYFNEKEELFFLLEDKLKDLNKIVNNKKEKFVNSPLLLSYGAHVDERENEVLKTKIFISEQRDLFGKSLFFKNNNEYIITDYRNNISQFEISDLNLVRDFLHIKVEKGKNLAELLELEKSSEKKIYDNYSLGLKYKDKKAIINKNDKYLSIAFLNNEEEIYKIAILNNNGNVFYAEKGESLAYSKLIFEGYKNSYIKDNYSYSDFFNIYLSNILNSILIFLVLNILLKITLFSVLIRYKKSLSNNIVNNNSFKINYYILLFSIISLCSILSTTFLNRSVILFDLRLHPYYSKNTIEYNDSFNHLSNYYKSIDFSKFKNIQHEEIFDKKNEKIYSYLLLNLYYFNQLEDYIMLKNNNEIVFTENNKEKPFYYKLNYTNENLSSLFKNKEREYLIDNGKKYLIASADIKTEKYVDKSMNFIETDFISESYGYSIDKNILYYGEKNSLLLPDLEYIKYVKDSEIMRYDIIDHLIEMMCSTSSLYLYFLCIYIGLYSNKRFIKFIKRRKKYKIKNNLISIEKDNNIEIKKIIKINN